MYKINKKNPEIKISGPKVINNLQFTSLLRRGDKQMNAPQREEFHQ